MQRAIIAAFVLLALSAGVCIASTCSIGQTLDKMETMHEEVLSYTDIDETDGALVALSRLATLWSEAGGWMEIVAPHEDVRDVRDQIVSAKALLENGDLAQYHQCMALLREALEHLRRHEKVSLSNVF